MIADAMMQEIFMAVMKREPKREGKLVMNGNFPWNLELSYSQGPRTAVPEAVA